MTNYSDGETKDSQDATPAEKLNLASKPVSDLYESWVNPEKRKPIRIDAQSSSLFFVGGQISLHPVNEKTAFFIELRNLLEKIEVKENFSSTEHWMREMDRFTSAMVTEIYKVREEIFQKTALNNAAKLLLSEILIESAEAGDPIEPLALTYGDAKKCSDFFHNMIIQSKVDFDRSMSSQSRDTSKAAGVYRFIKPKRK